MRKILDRIKKFIDDRKFEPMYFITVRIGALEDGYIFFTQNKVGKRSVDFYPPQRWFINNPWHDRNGNFKAFSDDWIKHGKVSPYASDILVHKLLS